MNMALVVQPTTMNVPVELGKAAADEEDHHGEPLRLQLPSPGGAGASVTVVPPKHHPQHALLQVVDSKSSTEAADAAEETTTDSSLAKKRPLDHDAHETAEEASPVHKRLRTNPTTKRSVQFRPDPSDESRVHTSELLFEVDYENADIWWTNEESQAHMERQASLLQFYANSCTELVDSVLLVWINCAEQSLDDGQFCLTPQQRADVSLKISQSACRGFDKEYASELISEQRLKTIGGILELQQLCHANGVTQEERIEALSAASIAFSQTATLFAQTLAQADAIVARE